jgi:hypothetical protein
MFKHVAVIFRPDTSAPFYYDVFNYREDPAYTSLVAKYQSNIIEDKIEISDDQLMCIRIIAFDSQASFENFFNEWTAVYPDYIEQYGIYCDTHKHIRTKFTEGS